MISFEKKFWLKFIHLINYYKSDFSGVENAIQILCKVNVADSDVDTIMEIIENNLEKPEISSCAAQIFFIMLDIIPFNHSDMIEKFNHLLQKCMNYDVIVLHLLSFYLKIDQEEIKSYYNNDNTSLNMIIQMLSQGFFECTSFFVMSQIMNVLYLFNNLFPNETSEMLKDLFEKLYSEFLEIIIEEDENDKLALSCCKLMVMCETNQLKDILENRHINTFCTVLKRHFKDNTKGIFIRFQTNILKHMWNKLARNDLMGLSPRLIVEIIRDIVVLLKLLLKNKQFDIFTSYMYITSLLDIYIYFQPSLAKHYPCLVFQKFQNQLNKEDFDSVAKFIEHYVFNTKCNQLLLIDSKDIILILIYDNF